MVDEEIKTKKAGREALGDSGQRVTGQRALLLDILHRSGEHLDADELYRRARRRQPRLSLSTVYRNLQLFKKLGLVSEHHFAEEHHHYEVKSAVEHQHLLCLGCGKIVEFDCPMSRQFKEKIGREHGFEITGVEVRMVGLCLSCRNQKAAKQE